MTKAGEAKQTAYLFSEQTQSWTAEGEPGKENGPNEAGGYFTAWACNGKKSCAIKILEVEEKNWDKKYSVKIKFKNSICDKAKKKTSCDTTLKLKMWCN